MKQLTVLLVFLLVTANIFAQDISQNNVPAVVLNAFQLKYGNASDVEWRLEKGNYRVNFEVNGKEHQLRLDDRGKIVKHEQDLYVSEIPKVVLETVQGKVPFFDVEDADKITENGQTTFEINFEIDDKDHDFWINEKGTLIKYVKELKRNEIPAVILATLNEKYQGYEIRVAELKEESAASFYDIQLRKSKEKVTLTFNPKGEIIGSTKNQ